MSLRLRVPGPLSRRRHLLVALIEARLLSEWRAQAESLVRDDIGILALFLVSHIVHSWAICGRTTVYVYDMARKIGVCRCDGAW